MGNSWIYMYSSNVKLVLGITIDYKLNASQNPCAFGKQA